MSVKVKTAEFEIVAPTADEVIKIINSLKIEVVIVEQMDEDEMDHERFGE